MDQEMLHQLRFEKCARRVSAYFKSHRQFSSVTAGWRLMANANCCYVLQVQSPTFKAVSRIWRLCGAAAASCSACRRKPFQSCSHWSPQFVIGSHTSWTRSSSNQAYQNTTRVRTSLSICAHCLKLAAFTWMPLSGSTPNASQTELYQRRFSGPSSSWSGDKEKVCCS